MQSTVRRRLTDAEKREVFAAHKHVSENLASLLQPLGISPTLVECLDDTTLFQLELLRLWGVLGPMIMALEKRVSQLEAQREMKQ